MGVLSIAGMLAFLAAAGGAAAHPCADVPLAAERLACYDKAFPPTPAVLQAEAARGVRDFGLQAAPIPRNPPDVEADPDAVEGRVTAVSQHSSGQRVVRLDSGQQWLLTEGGSRGPLADGDTVTVRKAALGSYMLVTPAGVTLRARRVR